MTAQALLDSLRREHEQIGNAIAFIEAHLGRNGKRAKASAIIASIAPAKAPKDKRPYKKRAKRKGLHWTQTPEGRATISRNMKAWHAKGKS